MLHPLAFPSAFLSVLLIISDIAQRSSGVNALFSFVSFYVMHGGGIISLAVCLFWVFSLLR